MELQQIKNNILEKITLNHAEEVTDINKIKMSSTEEELFLTLLSNIHVYLTYNILDVNSIKEYFSTETLEKYYVFLEGEHSVYGSKKVIALGECTLRMYNDSTCYAYQNTVIYAYALSTISAYDNSDIIARDESTVHSFDNAKVEAYFKSKVCAYDESSVKAYENVTVNSFNKATVELDDNACCIANGNSMVTGNNENYIELKGNSKGIFKLHSYGKASGEALACLYDDSEITLCGCAYAKCFDNSKCEGYDTSRIYSNGDTRITACNYCTVHCVKAAFAKVTDMAYMVDFSDTHSNVSWYGVIRWGNEKQLFYQTNKQKLE